MSDEREMQDLLRYLHGEMSPEERRRIEGRLAVEPELRAARERLERSWNGLELPPAATPPGFSSLVMERISSAEPEAPGWARLAAAAALAAGIALGVGIGRVPADDDLALTLAAPPVPSLAERYLTALEELDEGVGE